jgi:hypothetical protein
MIYTVNNSTATVCIPWFYLLHIRISPAFPWLFVILGNIWLHSFSVGDWYGYICHVFTLIWVNFVWSGITLPCTPPWRPPPPPRSPLAARDQSSLFRLAERIPAGLGSLDLSGFVWAGLIGTETGYPSACNDAYPIQLIRSHYIYTRETQLSRDK